jgi:hypothetical protein
MAERLVFDKGKVGFVGETEFNGKVPDAVPAFSDVQKQLIERMLEASRQYKAAKGQEILVGEENYGEWIEEQQTAGQNMLLDNGLMIPGAQLVALLSEQDLPIELLQELLEGRGLLHNSSNARKEAAFIRKSVPNRQPLTTGVAALLSSNPLMIDRQWSEVSDKIGSLSRQISRRNGTGV